MNSSRTPRRSPSFVMTVFPLSSEKNARIRGPPPPGIPGALKGFPAGPGYQGVTSGSEPSSTSRAKVLEEPGGKILSSPGRALRDGHRPRPKLLPRHLRLRDRGVQPGDERVPPRGPGRPPGAAPALRRGAEGRIPDPDGGASAKRRDPREPERVRPGPPDRERPVRGARLDGWVPQPHGDGRGGGARADGRGDRKGTRLNSSHRYICY